ncbi:major facilitator superfamily domain-containing protein [Echria macrotheca]|uniref:Major facilitator superfamily domain-containing protein n=1 Tax=Echria macrotheca TaxID=438768 RepID=A0AAJ0B6V2_9PEZI|nr:major facilitator superfamily domain-containing protein [Echria macrotheca]
MNDREPNESTRLLASHGQENESPLIQPEGNEGVASSPPGARRTILAVVSVQVILYIGSFVSLAAQLAILEDIVCKKYYEERLPTFNVSGEDRCKADAVQSEVAFINGWKDVFEILPAIALAVPYGALADRIGRKKVFLLAIIGIALNDLWIRVVFWFHDLFPVRAVWLSGVWQAIGAGAATLSSLSHVMVADVCPSDQRTTAFSYLQSATMVAQFLFVPIGGSLIPIDPWIPMFISTAATALGFLGALFFIPETIPPTALGNHNRVVDTETSVEEESSGRIRNPDSVKANSPEIWKAVKSTTKTTARWVFAHGKLVLVLTCFFMCSIGQQAGGSLFLQYASKRLDWSLGKASFFISLGAGINLVVHAIGIPALSSFMLWRLNLHEILKDKRIAQISGLFLVLGTGTTFAAGSWASLAAGQVLTSLGLAFVVPARSIVTSMVPKKHLAALYTAISVLLYGGMLTGAPLLAAAFHWGLRIGGLWLGMPFFLACVCFSLASLAVSSAPSNIDAGHDVVSEVEDEVDRTGF